MTYDFEMKRKFCEKVLIKVGQAYINKKVCREKYEKNLKHCFHFSILLGQYSKESPAWSFANFSVDAPIGWNTIVTVPASLS